VARRRQRRRARGGRAVTVPRGELRGLGWAGDVIRGGEWDGPEGQARAKEGCSHAQAWPARDLRVTCA
jgi:hypothetical protein